MEIAFDNLEIVLNFLMKYQNIDRVKACYLSEHLKQWWVAIHDLVIAENLHHMHLFVFLSIIKVLKTHII